MSLNESSVSISYNILYYYYRWSIYNQIRLTETGERSLLTWTIVVSDDVQISYVKQNGEEILKIFGKW